MTQDWKLMLKMKDYGSGIRDQGIMDVLEAKLSMMFSAQFFWYRGEKAAEFTHDGKGTITSTVFDAKIQNDLPNWWENMFPMNRDFEVVVNEENGSDEIRWQFVNGKCISCTRNDEELVEQGEEDLSVRGGCGNVQFYAKAGVVPNAAGKYGTDDYIGVVDDDWLIMPTDGNCGDIFIPMGASTEDLPSSDDDDYDEELRKEFLSTYEYFVVPYIKKGKRIGTNQMLFDASHGHEDNKEYEYDDSGIFDELDWVSSDEDEDKVCFFLNEVDIENSDGLLETIDSTLLCCHESAETVTIPEDITEIGNYAFYGCTSLNSVTIPASVTRIGSNAFRNCTWLQKIHFAGTKEQWASVNKDDDWHLSIPAASVVCTDGDVELPQLYIEDGVLKRYFGIMPFVTIPDGVTKIAGGLWEGAFKECTSLVSVSIPASVTEIGSKAFNGCTALSEIHYLGTMEQWKTVKIDSGWHFTIPATEIACADGAIELEDLVIEDGILKECRESVTELTIPEGVTKVDSEAFKSFPLLTSVTIPSSVTVIGCEAFRSCRSLESVTIAEGVTEIWDEAFRGCRALESITIPASVTSISDGAFRDCENLDEINFGGTKEQWAAIEKGEKWHEDIPAEDVHCTDGDADIDG